LRHVVTDGQRILASATEPTGWASIGKLAIYTAGRHRSDRPSAGDARRRANNEELRNVYLSRYCGRLEGKAYFYPVDEFVRAVQSRYPDALIQFGISD
jgi:malate dehydrogenase (oxaloacetate-decarboxylating)(NADP+)